MGQPGLPFAPALVADRDPVGGWCDPHALLSPALQAACAENPCLEDYVLHLPIEDLGAPDYYPKLSRELQKLKHRNLIYPIKDGLFVHVYPDAVGAPTITSPSSQTS